MAPNLIPMLEGISTLRQKAGNHNGYRYNCFEEFVLAEGRPWTPASLHPSLPRMAPRQCFANCTMLMLGRPDLTYVEGFALRIIPVMHAWLVDSDGTVYDPTLDAPETVEFYGVPFDSDWVFDTVRRRGFYGVIDNPQERWPLLKGDVPAYRSTRFPKPA